MVYNSIQSFIVSKSFYSTKRLLITQFTIYLKYYMKSLITKIKYDNRTLTNSANFTKDYIGLGLGQSNAVEGKKFH